MSAAAESDPAVDLTADPVTRLGQVDWPTVVEDHGLRLESSVPSYWFAAYSWR